MKKERQQNSLQTDQEFLQNQIKKLNKKYKGSTVFAAEQKICDLEKILFKTKTLEKRLKKRIKAKEIITKATNNMKNRKF